LTSYLLEVEYNEKGVRYILTGKTVAAVENREEGIIVV
jgi:hypothetical protein